MTEPTSPQYYDPQKVHSISCPKCSSQYIVTHLSKELKFCAHCGLPFKQETEGVTKTEEEDEITLVEEHDFSEASVKFTVGPYKILSSIGKGGMGEVFSAYDPTCGRLIALKKIRDDFSEHAAVEKRFLREARITSQLNHPAIIPIYSLHHEAKNNYYTMPYMGGETLKQLIRRAKTEEKLGVKVQDPAFSISAFIRHFTAICQAIAYAHSKKVLHRDLKPENIIVGKFGQVLILDWGLAELWDPESEKGKGEKVTGTVAYMPPEKVLGAPDSPQSDIYALGVILYQLLTLKMPFNRGSIKEFRKKYQKEVLVDPGEVAPWREVPRVLAQIVMKSLDPDPSKRYASVQELLNDLESYLEGRAEFYPLDSLDVSNPDDWEFQENVLIAEHMALTRNAENAYWVNQMISKRSFSDSLRVEFDITPGPEMICLGILLSVPEKAERDHVLDGYCLGLVTKNGEKSRFLKSGLDVLNLSDLKLEIGKTSHIKFEKHEKTLKFWLNDRLEFTYVSHIPLFGTHIGLIFKNFDFEISEIQVSEGSQNVMINCLSIPDAFLARKDYSTALSEYRRIAYAFPGRAEGLEGAFRAGIVLLEEAQETTDIEEGHKLLDLAIEEFEKLHNTPGAPLEYLGKALVYHTLQDDEEEVKCFELAFRRYKNHPLLNVLEEQVLFRMHECSKYDRKAAYAFLLLVLVHMPEEAESYAVKKMLESIEKHSEPLWFIDPAPMAEKPREYWMIVLAFWLNKGWIIQELLPKLDDSLKENAYWALVHLHEEPETPSERNPERLKRHHLKNLLKTRKLDALLQESQDEEALVYRILRIQAWLLKNDTKEAEKELLAFPLEWHTQETSLLPFLYGCWLYLTEGKELAWIHFSGMMETAFPRTWALGSLSLIDKLPPNWKKRAFEWEKEALYAQLQFFKEIEKL
ncbi:MAG: protein kinase [Chlamydiia bacterium]|nr:protein kinase [Chlamydiia bacterium]